MDWPYRSRRLLIAALSAVAVCASNPIVQADELTIQETAGTIAASSPAPHPLNLMAPTLRALGADPGPFQQAEATRISYTTTREDGSPTIATGLVMDSANPDAPTLVMAPGTRGQGDNCAPSGSWLQLGSVDAHSLNVNYELPIMYLALQRGWRVVMTDYIGLGTSDLHRYVNRIEQAHSVLDIARATTAPGTPVAFYGYSQGGSAAAAAAELAESYAPELNLLGSVVGAPPADLHVISTSVDESFLTAGLGYAMNAGAHEPEVAEALERNLTPEGQQFLTDTANACTVDSVARWGFQSVRNYTIDGASAREIIDREPALSGYLDRQKLGKTAPSRPVLIASNRHDTLIPFSQVNALAHAWCSKGTDVVFAEFNEDAGTATHLVGMFQAVQPAFDWLDGRAQGLPAPNTCASLPPIQP